MDLWVVAAAAGAGCIAKNLQNFSADKKESPHGPSLKCSSSNTQTESRNFLQQLRDKTCPLRRLAQKRGQDDSVLDVNGDYSEVENGILGVGENQQFLDGENLNLSKINGGNKLARRNRRCQIRQEKASSCLYPASISPARPVLITDAMWGETPSPAQFDARVEETGRDGETSSPALKHCDKGSSGLSRSQEAETMLLFMTGMTVGIVSATASWINEADELNRQLGEMQGLVQDLHGELDMREMVTVKELGDEGDLPLSTEEPASSPSLAKADGNDERVENLELLSRIEAELQAELEMLELNMKVSDQDIISSVVELDPDFELEIVRGELKPEMVEDATESESRTTDTTTDCSKPANYSVSPWELSLRLHELIESRLETRIKELEIAILQSENGVGRRYSYSETESSSAHHSPTCICDEHEHDKRGHSTNGLHNGSYNSVKDTPQIWDNKQQLMSLESNEDPMIEDESSDESEMLLIKQILERRKSEDELKKLACFVELIVLKALCNL